MKRDAWNVAFCTLMAGPVLYWTAMLLFACRSCGRFAMLRRGLCYSCWRRLHV